MGATLKSVVAKTKAGVKMNLLTSKSDRVFLEKIESQVLQNKRISASDGIKLLQLTDPQSIEDVGSLADEFRKQKVQDTIVYANTLFIHPTNLCELSCQMCSFYAKPGWDKAWFLSPDKVMDKIKRHAPKQLNEIHVVGGLWRDCNLDYYEELFALIRDFDPTLHIKALTPVEYDFLAKLHNIKIETVFKKMISFGLNSLPGGGAEVLVEAIRKKIAYGKISSDEFLQIHRLVHRLGLSSNVTMLFGHLESEADLITHMIKIRNLQDETQGFTAFVPLKFGLENNALGKRKNRLFPKNTSLIYAVSRLMLDNIAHIKVLWNYIGIDQALKVLTQGGSDFSSTNMEEKVIQMAGGVEYKMDSAQMETMIRSLGRVPKQTHSGVV